MLEIKYLTKNFSGKKILEDLNFIAKKGQINVLMGASGCGKSTLLKILSGIEKKDHGEIFYNSQHLEASEKNRWKYIGFVSQNFGLFKHLNTYQNIELVFKKVLKLPRYEVELKTNALIQAFNLSDQINHLPHKLSGGQKQRLAIARAMAAGPDFLCLDEPSSALDPHLSYELAEMLHKLSSENRGIIVTTHDLAFVKMLNCQLNLLKEGRIVESVSAVDYKHSSVSYPYLNYYLERS